MKSYHIPVEQIDGELNDIETNLAQLEKEGVELEKKLRSCEEGTFFLLLFPWTSFLSLFTHSNKIECWRVQKQSARWKINSP